MASLLIHPIIVFPVLSISVSTPDVYTPGVVLIAGFYFWFLVVSGICTVGLISCPCLFCACLSFPVPLLVSPQLVSPVVLHCISVFMVLPPVCPVLMYVVLLVLRAVLPRPLTCSQSCLVFCLVSQISTCLVPSPVQCPSLHVHPFVWSPPGLVLNASRAHFGCGVMSYPAHYICLTLLFPHRCGPNKPHVVLVCDLSFLPSC